MNDAELGKLIVCFWKPPTKNPPWRGGWYPVPPERREEFRVTKKPGPKRKEAHESKGQMS